MIKEIIGYRVPTVMPGMPGSILGVINLRGSVVPVMDPMAPRAVRDPAGDRAGSGVRRARGPGARPRAGRTTRLPVSPAVLSEGEFARFRQFILDAAGITLTPSRKALVSGRLARRLAVHGLDSYGRYLDLLDAGAPGTEVRVAVDLLTTNETYFFREARHFVLLRTLAMDARMRNRGLRVWSAACSSGEEVYSIAMVLDDLPGDLPWDVTGSDISSRVRQRASTGHYLEERARLLPAWHRRTWGDPPRATGLAPAREVPAGEPERDAARARRLRHHLPAQREGICDTVDQLAPSVFRKH